MSEITDLRAEISAQNQIFLDRLDAHSVRITTAKNDAANATALAYSAITNLYQVGLDAQIYTDNQLQTLRDEMLRIVNAMGVSTRALAGSDRDNVLAQLNPDLQALLANTIAAVEVIADRLGIDLANFDALSDFILNEELPGIRGNLSALERLAIDTGHTLDGLVTDYDFDTIVEGFDKALLDTVNAVAPLQPSELRKPAALWTIHSTNLTFAPKLPPEAEDFIVNDPILGECYAFPPGAATIGPAHPTPFDPSKVYRLMMRVRVTDNGPTGKVLMNFGATTWGADFQLQYNVEAAEPREVYDFDGEIIQTCYVTANPKFLSRLENQNRMRIDLTAGSSNATHVFFHARQNYNNLSSGRARISIFEITDVTAAFATTSEVFDKIDANPPALPTGLSFSSSLNGDGRARVTATWNIPSGDDVAGYDLALSENGGGEVVFSTVANRWEFNTLPGTPLTGRVRAKDRFNNLSAYSALVPFTPAGDTVAPDVPTGLKITEGFKGLWLDWNRNTDADFAQYELLEQNSATPAPTAQTVASFYTGANQLARNGLGYGTTRHYWIRAVDTSGNKSAWSARVQGTTLTKETITNEDIRELVDATSFAANVEPVTIVSGDTLPTVKSTHNISFKGKLYRWNGTAYTSVVEALDVDSRGLNILDVGGNIVFGADGTVGAVASIKLNGNNVLLSTIAANSLVPSLNFVGPFSSPPTQQSLGANWKQNAVYKNTTDSKSYVLTGEPLAWQEYLADGQQFTLEIESSNGTAFKVGRAQSTLLTARVFKNGAEVTDATPASWFRWRRVSIIPQPPPNDDATWNASYTTGYKSVSINVDQVYARATFFCDLIS
jgi:hypothetical protein